MHRCSFSVGTPCLNCRKHGPGPASKFDTAVLAGHVLQPEVVYVSA